MQPFNTVHSKFAVKHGQLVLKIFYIGSPRIGTLSGTFRKRDVPKLAF